ncbi:CoA-binding protein [Legionella steelei]|uniref:CoA-binding protein n=2 Tax=Legionella steelei TaxID=947033 RepID=A0A0W0ZGC5_9GAMM|nr:CoA-binding protein [Legionella steelei]
MDASFSIYGSIRPDHTEVLKCSPCSLGAAPRPQNDKKLVDHESVFTAKLNRVLIFKTETQMTNQQIDSFFQSKAFAVIGASSNREKYGNKVLRCYQQNGKKVYPVNPQEKLIEGLSVIALVSDLPREVESISIITPPAVTEKIVEEAIQKGIKNIWMQPGAESDKAIQNCKQHKINIIAGGPCILVILGYKEH